jgi:uncharacterized protein YpmB
MEDNMKTKTFLYIITIILIIAVIFSVIYLYITSLNNVESNNENNIYSKNNNEKINLISNVEEFLFTNKNIKLIYEGGPSHWGSKTITLDNFVESESNKKATLHIIDESDLKGDLPKKQWDEVWEANSDGSLYIDNILMLKSPIVVGQKWGISDYVPVVNSNKKYTATIVITNIVDSLNAANQSIKKVTTTLTIDDIKTVDNSVYTETRIFETGLGITEFKVTEPTISDLQLNYWLQDTKSIE